MPGPGKSSKSRTGERPDGGGCPDQAHLRAGGPRRWRALAGRPGLAARDHLWLKEIAPSTALRKWFGHQPARFAEFRRRYLDEIRANAPALERLRSCLEGGRVTLLYAAHDPAHNNAVVLADYLRDQAGRQHVRHSA
jgi:uncharacterized protein YeaO (DUF488 family)